MLSPGEVNQVCTTPNSALLCSAHLPLSPLTFAHLTFCSQRFRVMEALHQQQMETKKKVQVLPPPFRLPLILSFLQRNTQCRPGVKPNHSSERVEEVEGEKNVACLLVLMCCQRRHRGGSFFKTTTRGWCSTSVLMTRVSFFLVDLPCFLPIAPVQCPI